jgi:hypothetical protein
MFRRLKAVSSGVFFVASSAVCSATSSTFPLQCAERDVQVLTLIEERAQSVSGDQVAAAFFRLVEARQTCVRDGVGAGLARYEGILPTPTEVSATRN